MGKQCDRAPFLSASRHAVCLCFSTDALVYQCLSTLLADNVMMPTVLIQLFHDSFANERTQVLSQFIWSCSQLNVHKAEYPILQSSDTPVSKTMRAL